MIETPFILYLDQPRVLFQVEKNKKKKEKNRLIFWVSGSASFEESN